MQNKVSFQSYYPALLCLFFRSVGRIQASSIRHVTSTSGISSNVGDLYPFLTATYYFLVRALSTTYQLQQFCCLHLHSIIDNTMTTKYETITSYIQEIVTIEHQ